MEGVNMKKLMVMVLVIAMATMLLAGCSIESNPGSDSSQPSKVTVNRYSLATGGTGGTYYPIGSGVAAIVTKHVDSVELNAESTGGSVANLKMAQEKNVDFLLAGASTAYAAYSGREPFETPINNVKGMTALYPETFQFVVLNGSEINSFDDLKGKKIAVGSPGSGTERSAKKILEAHGITYDDIDEQYLGFSEAVTSLKDRLIDCAIVASGIPTSAVVDAAATLDIKLLPIDPVVVEGLIEDNPYYRLNSIKGNTYNGVEEDIVAVATPALLLAREDIDDETVYNMVKAFYENIEEIESVHAQGKNITLENATSAMSIPLHPGAEKYYREQGLID